jgi:ceramide glucosyltransferase
MIAVAIVAAAFGLPVAPSVAAFVAFWYGGEMLLAAAAGWHVSMFHPLYGLARDLLVPALFVGALRGNGFVWRGNEMQVERMRPHGMMALMRPRVHEFAKGSRRRLRAFRARTS